MTIIANIVADIVQGNVRSIVGGVGAPRFTVLDSDGNSFSVPLHVLNSSGTSFTVSTVVLDSDGNSFNPI